VTPELLTEGAELPSREFGPISRSDIVRYQGASGDFNPIHHDEPFAREAGYANVIGVGMLQAGYVGTYCVDLFGPESVRQLSVRFRDTVAPGDVLVCTGKVASVDAVDGVRAARLEINVERSSGGTVLTGTATVAVA
jgi:acyl dehydratase